MSQHIAAPPARASQEHSRRLLPLSPQQRRLWVLAQLRQESVAYNEVAAWRLRGPLDASLLQRSLTHVVSMHEALRASFPTIDGEPVQVIAPPQPLHLPVLDVPSGDGADSHAAVQRLAAQVARRPFDLERGPLFRPALLRLGERDHVLVIAVHHIVFDGWSAGVFRRDLCTAYAALQRGLGTPRAGAGTAYSEAMLRSDVERGDADASLDYWRRHLAGMPPLLSLPTARARPDVESHAGARTRFAVERPLVDRLTALAGELDTTPYVVLLAALQALVFRCSGEGDVACGSAMSARTAEELENLVGFFVDTVVIRTQVDGRLGFRSLVAQVRDAVLDARDHSAVPFDRLIEAVRPERSPSHNPLFQLMFVLQGRPHDDVRIAGLDVETVSVDPGTAKYDLTLEMSVADDGLHGTWEYSTDLFDSIDVTRMGDHLLALLHAVVAEPDRPVDTLPLLTPGERVQIERWNATATEPPEWRRIDDAVGAQAARTPQAIAVRHGAVSLTYAALDRRAAALARTLHRHGVGPGSLVGVSTAASPEMLVALLGVLRAGAAYVPLDAAYPAARLAAMLAQSGATVVVADRRESVTWVPAETRVVLLDHAEEDGNAPGGETPFEQHAAAEPSDLAYVIFTSGSTGQPKGVMVTHGNLVHSTHARHVVYGEAPSAFLLLSSLSFDSSAAGIWWTLTGGGTLVLPDRDGPPDPAHLHEVIRRCGVSHVLCIPSLYDLLLTEMQGDAAALRTVIVAGETCPPDLVERHLRLVPGVELFNEYGPTEATVWSTVHRCDSVPRGRPVPIGRPIPNTRVHILDPRTRRPVPIGARGELHIAGDGVARGYLGDVEATARRFLPDPFSSDAGARMYATGDLGRWLPDGTVEMTGRTDEQVKLRGYRIEPAEVEAQLTRHSAVAEAVVTLRGEDRGRPCLVAHVVPAAGGVVDAAALRRLLLDRLPSYMVPAEIVPVPALPRLPNGKCDRRAVASLPALDASPPSHEAPAREDEPAGIAGAVAAIWQETLQRPAVGLDDNFFEIGGDSLSVVAVFNRLRRITDRDIAITDLFKHPTLRDLVGFLDE